MRRISSPRRSTAWLLVAAVAACLAATPAWGADAAKPTAPATLPVLDVRAADGRFVSLTPTASNGAVAVVFYSSECPISNGFSPTLKAIAALGADRPLGVVGVCVDADLKAEDVRKHAQEFGLDFPVVQDRDGSITRRFAAQVTPEVFVYDAQRQLRYHGRIDDQYAARGKRNARHATNELRDAVTAVLDGKPVAVAQADAVGCPVPTPPDATPPSYTRDVAPILRSNCVGCHRPGQVGPFALETYDQARKRASDIASVTTERMMPPWKPAADFGPALKHSKALTGDEIALLARWAEGGATEGKAEDLGPAPVFSSDWALGTPDLVVQTPEDYVIPAQGEDIYRCFVIPTDLPDDKYISAIEYHPGNRKIVHHVLGYVDKSGGARIKDEREPGPGYMCFGGPGVPTHGDLGGWAPGTEPSFLPAGVGRSLPKKADLVVQVHYHPSGKPETDRTTVGLYFSKAPIKQTLHWNAALNIGMKIPAGQANTEVKANWEVPVDVTALGIAPHMHLLGHDMTMTATLPDGKNLDLIRINEWDFDWQNNYWFDRPIDLPKGSVLRVVAHFDNSTANPRNPKNPPVEVRWGEGTADEMCIGFLAMTKKGQDLTRAGERDDLNLIFQKQGEERLKKYEERRRKAAAEASQAPRPTGGVNREIGDRRGQRIPATPRTDAGSLRGVAAVQFIVRVRAVPASVAAG